MEPDDDLGLFGPDSVTWRVHAGPIMPVAGLRSLYLQALHPRAIAGVTQNSSFRADPWGRLGRTLQYLDTVLYGTTAEAEDAARRVRRRHATMRATDPDTGEEFRVDDPELLRWVHVAEVESFLTVALGTGLRLTPAEADSYHTEQRRAAALLGLDPATVPGTVADVADYYADIRPQLRITPDAAATFAFLSAPPLPTPPPTRLLRGLPLRLLINLGPPRLVWTGLATLAVSLLPAWARRHYGLPGLPTTDLSAAVSTRALHLALSPIPRHLYDSPRHKQAIARATRLGVPLPA
ncbi:oxygenase MpaB family protein [Catenuloplanes sp. NPDC051500]|uniref:oxygenase MpaB family protein n=1 Tax=Catenuloplanes sp. NPDC051500 TaxID=3363959 RepID=UPI0037B520B8